MNDEEIDRSQWLPPDAPVINEFRLSKADIAIDRLCDACLGEAEKSGVRCAVCRGRGRLVTAWRGHDLDPISDIRFAQAKVKNILSYLHHTDILNDQHAHDGRTYEIWYEIFKAAGSMEKKPLYGALRGELAREGLSEYGFILLINSMPATYHDTIKRTIYTMQSEHTRFLARRNADHYKRVFGKLSEQIPIIRDKLKQIAEKDAQKDNSGGTGEGDQAAGRNPGGGTAPGRGY